MAAESAYPANLDTFTMPNSMDAMNATSKEHADQHQKANSALVKMQTVLGRNPQGAYATVTARLDAASYTGHTHLVANITGLQAALDSKSPVGHRHAPSDIDSVTGTAGKTLAHDLAERPLLSNLVAAPLGSSAQAGTMDQAARVDHIHPLPTPANIGAASASNQITAGIGLTGGGALTSSVTLAADLVPSGPYAGTASTVARGDHNHDNRYYTEMESDARFSATNHNHDGVYVKVIAQPTTTSSLPSTAGLPAGTILAVYTP